MTKLILAVEDQEDNMQILRDLLTSAGYEIVGQRTARRRWSLWRSGALT
jgi:CheY-like chemotaxis protein